MGIFNEQSFDHPILLLGEFKALQELDLILLQVRIML